MGCYFKTNTYVFYKFHILYGINFLCDKPLQFKTFAYKEIKKVLQDELTQTTIFDENHLLTNSVMSLKIKIFSKVFIT